jgi:hypothetical protein
MGDNMKIYYYTLNRANNTLREEVLEAIERQDRYKTPRGDYARVWYPNGKNFYKSKTDKLNNVFGIKVELFSLKEVANKDNLLAVLVDLEDKRTDIQFVVERFEKTLVQ